MKIRSVTRDGAVENQHSSDFNDDELMNIALGGGGERMGTRMLAAELLALRQCVSGLAKGLKSSDAGKASGEALETILDVYMSNPQFGPRWEAGE